MQTVEERAASKALYYRNNKDKSHAAVREWRKAHPERVAQIHRKSAGHPEPTRPEPSVCECCGNVCASGKRLSLDHDHVTNVFRGWLCMKCNTSIGKLGDSIAGVLKAVAYLQRAIN